MSGFFVIFDKINICVYLIDIYGKIFRIFCCNFGLIIFDKYYNIFVIFFDIVLIWVYDIDGIYIIDLNLDERLRSILILYDKLFVVVECGCKVYVYDIIYK